MEDLSFNLSQSYCLMNKILIESQNGSCIKFLLENNKNTVLKETVSKAFKNYVQNLIKNKACPNEFYKEPQIDFVAVSKLQFQYYFSKRFKASEVLDNIDYLLETILNEAKERNVTDIHIEKNRVRFRIYDKLQDYCLLPQNKVLALINRIKSLTQIEFWKKTLNQEGTFVFGDKNPMFIRISTLRLIDRDLNMNAESLVMHLLDPFRVPLEYKNLGFSKEQTEKLYEIMMETSGMFLVCGSCGTGKSTTIASILTEIERLHYGKLKIITLENPPEFILENICQVDMGSGKSDKFEMLTEKIFRQNPDVLMVGEIRDKKIAEFVCQASMMGLFVIAELRANSFSNVMTRLGGFGLSKDFLDRYIKGVLLQDINYFENQCNLLADLIIPKIKYSKRKKNYVHITNYSYAVRRSVQKMIENRNYEAEYKFNKKNYKKNQICKQVGERNEFKKLIFKKTEKKIKNAIN